MELPVNKFKQGLKGDQPMWGLWLGLPDASCAELVAGAGFDWLLIDSEHAPFELDSTMRHLQAIAPYGVPAIVRPEEGRTALLKRILDIGAQTVLVPMCDTAEQARELVKAVKYPPQGIRGLGSSLARAANWNRIPGYLQKANDEICLVVQAETVTAMENLAEIAAVEGVDAVFIGPSDLSASMGHIGNPDHPEVVAAIEKGFEIINAAGKAAGLLCINQAKAHHYVAKGAKFVGVGVDTLLLSNAAKQLAESFKAGDSTSQGQTESSQSSGY
ncbi:4-hydroxy-2-oxoheptanedioate aldolase [Amphritea sp. 2_MG-2023]|jgi:4-hydroxy-2-oxoheptanedioate aldolase|uniref:4-hydroxy-2-oxoheptanedioate aldolase n=1 Tax=Amphritea TaxID=515417 RepID=UPI001C07BE16|nr:MULTISPECIES: 4-hydroxy-2-oxoheptanedioate aldolase [Amphritea]MBU2964576.1 4-hydroxy-2-oxoheptanedioate aldolase [Amphritea atlantica]MDO6417905.1 4-hydroxy-2-oxoheptanedioate aldolase [Amphritea sp. 2_MG-2023]MDX2421220.1 4-hydroxy-2-oxoheptanedioate aldolase [Amphritea sp.]